MPNLKHPDRYPILDYLRATPRLTGPNELVGDKPCLAAQARALATRTSLPSLSWILPRAKRTQNTNRLFGKIRLPSHSASLAEKRGEEHEHPNCRQRGDGRLPNELLRPVGTMTAEIAILNRRAAALSADSAVTITQTGKIYNSADKIFELTTSDPIGLMVYNSLDYMGIPLDVIIKTFRESPRCAPHFHNIFDAASAFFDFLRNDFEISEEAQNFHIEDLLFEHVRTIAGLVLERTARRMAEGMSPPGRRARSVTISFHEIFETIIDTEIAKLRRLPINECFYDVSKDDLIDRYGSVIDSLPREVSPFLREMPPEMLEKFGA